MHSTYHVDTISEKEISKKKTSLISPHVYSSPPSKIKSAETLTPPNDQEWNILLLVIVVYLRQWLACSWISWGKRGDSQDSWASRSSSILI